MTDTAAYKEQTDKLMASAQAIKTAAEHYGVKSTLFTMALFGELMKMMSVESTFAALPKAQRDEFLAELWDSAIGTEPNALVHQVGAFSPEITERLSDAVKDGALAYFNRALPAAA